jgi:hypothetical protein
MERRFLEYGADVSNTITQHSKYGRYHAYIAGPLMVPKVLLHRKDLAKDLGS